MIHRLLFFIVVSCLPHLLWGLLSDSQKESYAQSGYLVIPGFYDEAACDILRQRADELVDASSIYSELNWLQRPKDFPFTGF